MFNSAVSGPTHVHLFLCIEDEEVGFGIYDANSDDG